jgi:sugar transferase (PEP-CTERM/EpsH1 system associated)
MSKRPSVLFLCQRLPFPPDKGEKIAAFNIARHLGRRFDLHVGTFVDRPEDVPQIGRFRPYCASLHVARIRKPWAWLPAALRWLGGQPLSFGLFRSTGLNAYVRRVIREHRPVAMFAYSSNVADYAMTPAPRATVRVLHFSDVDSEKFADYAARARGWRRRLYALEARRVRAAEARLAQGADAVAFVSDEEATLFRSVVDPGRAQILTLANGVDTVAFDPGKPWPMPQWGNGPAFVFTGAMDYPPNIEAAAWFADAVLPALRAAAPATQFVIVGSNPAPSMAALASRPGIVVTGRVPQVQPYLAHAAVAVAPLRIARGIQNKVLEALAMGRPTIVSPGALTGIGTAETTPVVVADGADEWIAACLRLLADPDAAAALAARGRPFVIDRFNWAERLRPLDDLLPAA